MYCERVDMSFSASDAPNLKPLHYFNKIFFNRRRRGDFSNTWGSLMGPGSDLDDLAKILSRFRGLETLAVRTGKLTGCKKLAAAILLHKDTLKFLMINDSHETIDRGWGQFSFIDVARSAKSFPNWA